jgi:hypothetical protein
MDVTTNIPESRIADLLCAGFEGGVGYWCVITGYDTPDNPRSAQGDDEIFPHVDYPLCGGAVLCEAHLEDEFQDEPETLTLDREAVERGLRLMAEKYPRHWADFIAENEDACTGDVFIQCALLGEVVYG